jgi:hypothetical protein
MAIAVVALFQQIMSMVSIMGGLRLTETQQILLDYRSNVFGVAFYGFIPTLLLGIGLAVAIRKHADSIAIHRFRSSVLQRSTWAIPVLAFLGLTVAAASFQPSRYRAARVDRMLNEGQIDEAITFMQQQGKHRFPQVWDPPPHFPTRRKPSPPISDLLSAIGRNHPDRWISDRLLVQADELLMWQFGWTQGVGDENYLRSTLYITDREALVEMQAHFEKLVDIPASGEEQQRRARLLQIVKEAIPKAEAFENDLPVSEVTEPEPETDSQRAEAE